MNRANLLRRVSRVPAWAVLAIACLFLSGAVPAKGAPPAIKDEANVPPYTLPDPLVCVDGTRVTDAKAWREKRRPELMRLFESEMYGRTPIARPAELKFVVRDEK
jgi:hypothetical protein